MSLCMLVCSLPASLSFPFFSSISDSKLWSSLWILLLALQLALAPHPSLSICTSLQEVRTGRQVGRGSHLTIPWDEQCPGRASLGTSVGSRQGYRKQCLSLNFRVATFSWLEIGLPTCLCCGQLIGRQKSCSGRIAFEKNFWNCSALKELQTNQVCIHNK